MTFGIFLAALVLALALGFVAYYFSALRPRSGTLDWITLADRQPLTFAHRRHPMAKKDALPVLLITLIYAVTAFFQLGSFKAPQQYYDFSGGQSFTLHIESLNIEGEAIPASRIWAYSSLGTGSYNLEVSADGQTWSTLTTRVEKDQWGRDQTVYFWSEDAHDTFALSQDYIQLFKWQDIVTENAVEAQYIRLTGRADRGQQILRLGKLLFLDAQGKPIVYSWSCPDVDPDTDIIAFSSIFSIYADDADTVPAAISWRNSSYFDEIYHPRTALENIENLHPYEITHPPLGKLILGLGIRLFGMTPFGWRFMGTLFGVLMLPLLYIFLKNMFGKTPVAACGTILFATEFMHLTQTRIATIDTYGVFFILLSYFFFYRWLTSSATPNKKGKTGEGYGSLALSGVTWGIGCACKWTVVYAGVGLAVMYLIHMILRVRAWNKDNEPAPQPETPAPDPLDLDVPFTFTPAPVPVRRQKSLGGWLAKTLLLSVLCFVVLPAVIYTASYIPYAASKGSVTFASVLDEMWRNQSYMLHYHQGVNDPHAYSSRWYQWLVDARPILFYLQDMGGGMTERFASFNNPLISWAGLLSLAAVVIRLFQRRCGKALFLVIAFLSQFLPWVFITRTTFAYHYFPSILFLIFCICYLFDGLIDCKWAKWRLPVYGLTTASTALYALFYPALIGLTMPLWYSNDLLRFLPSWPF